MKIVSFFNEKGGSGKTTHSIMFASYLSYVEHKSVMVIDFDYPYFRGHSLRLSELSRMNCGETNLSRYFGSYGKPDSFYDYIRCTDIGPVNSFKSIPEIVSYMSDVINYLVPVREKYDYVIFDLPGEYSEFGLAKNLLERGFCSLIVVPVDTDIMSRQAAWYNAITLRKRGYFLKLFWNNVSSADIVRPGYLDAGETPFIKDGLKFYPERIKSFQRAKRDSDWMLFVRSTVCFPTRYVELACPELIPFYQHVKRDIDAT